MDFKSHTRKEVLKALQEGKEVWVLDTGDDDKRDIALYNNIIIPFVIFLPRFEPPPQFQLPLV